MTRLGYGTYVGPGPGEGLELREEIQLTEAAGFDAIFFSEHHGTERYPPSPLALASYALGATSTLRSGPMPLLLPLHDPVRVAEESALLDFVSGGRLVLGLAAGYLPRDFEQIGIPVDDRGPRLDEGLDVLHRVWEGTPQQFQGRFSTYQSTGPLTYPPEAGRLPLLIASSAVPGLRRAARWGAGVMIDSLRATADVAKVAGRYRELCKEAGRRPGTVGAIRRIWLGDEAETERFIAAFGAELERYLVQVGPGRGPVAKALHHTGVTREAILDRVFVGRPEEVAETIGAWATAAGVEYVMLKVQWGMRVFEQIKQQLQRAAVVCERLAG
jgi:alkanesulfonate monooxygenase SsuD/methylene tetrahydromethanopterin reductase-like flavin-dependent oxidoreductase (luciferase family)